MLLDVVGKRNKRLVLYHGHDDPTLLEETCALDVADRGGVTFREAASLLGVRKNSVQVIEVGAVDKVRQGGGMVDYAGHDVSRHSPKDDLTGENEGQGLDDWHCSRPATRRPFLPDSHVALVEALAARSEGQGPTDEEAEAMLALALEDEPEDQEGWCARVWAVYERESSVGQRVESGEAREVDFARDREEDVEVGKYEEAEKIDRETMAAYNRFVEVKGRVPRAVDICGEVQATEGAMRQRLLKLRRAGRIPRARPGRTVPVPPVPPGFPGSIIGVEAETGPLVVSVDSGSELLRDEPAEREGISNEEVAALSPATDDYVVRLLESERDLLGRKLLQLDDAITRLRGSRV